MEKEALSPSADSEIGGGNHAILNRDGHLHIKTLPEMFGIIMEMYNNLWKVQHAHGREPHHFGVLPPRSTRVGKGTVH